MAFGHKAFIRRVGRIEDECQRYGLKSLQGRMFNKKTTSKSRSTSNAQTTLQDKDDLKDDMHIRPQHRQTHKTTTLTRPILVPSSKKNRPFAEIFHPTIWNCRKFSIYLPHRKTFTTHSFTTSIHTIECFSRQRDIYQQRAIQ